MDSNDDSPNLFIHGVVVVHGGAWAIPEQLWEASIEGVQMAAIKAYEVLKKGSSCVDAVETAIMSMEDDSAFDAGTGSVLTEEGEIEMDALIMRGVDLEAGAVAGIRNIANPICVARKVMENTQHVLIADRGANKFALLQGILETDPEELLTPMAKQDLETYKKFRTTVETQFDNKFLYSHDTVGCAVLDTTGHTACGTSTGGITAKMAGRVGDSPLVGAGGMANDEAGAVSATGHGESIVKVLLCGEVLNHIKQGKGTTQALESALEYMKKRVGGYGGAVGVSTKGEPGFAFTTVRMAWAYIKEGKLHYGLHKGQHSVRDL